MSKITKFRLTIEYNLDHETTLEDELACWKEDHVDIHDVLASAMDGTVRGEFIDEDNNTVSIITLS